MQLAGSVLAGIFAGFSVDLHVSHSVERIHGRLDLGDQSRGTGGDTGRRRFGDYTPASYRRLSRLRIRGGPPVMPYR